MFCVMLPLSHTDSELVFMSSFCAASSHSAFVIFPLASGYCNVVVLLVPGEEVGEGQGAIGLHSARQQVELCPPRAYQGVGAAQVDEEPLLEEVLGIVGQERALADKLNPALHLKLWLP